MGIIDLNFQPEKVMDLAYRLNWNLPTYLDEISKLHLHIKKFAFSALAQEVHEVQSPNGRLEQDPIHSKILTGLDYQVICYLAQLSFDEFFGGKKSSADCLLKVMNMK